MTAIYYHPEAYTKGDTKLMGRNAAGDSFLRGYFEYAAPTDFLYTQISSTSHAQQFADTARSHGRIEPIQPFSLNDLRTAERAENIYFPGPDISAHANYRRLLGDTKWSLCGITHTTSSAYAMDAIADWVTKPVQPWDAVICTSKAVKKNVLTILESQRDFLRERLSISKLTLPQLPVIPLGIHTKDFSYNEAQRVSARAKLSVNERAIVVLYTGRLSFHAKAHPLVMYQALETAAQVTGRQVTLVECGWHSNEHIKEAFYLGSALSCPSVHVVNLDGRKEENLETAWACADIFCSLSDNIQETFGIVPIEAMAAGLPVLVSDWNGYKDTVRDGLDGFRIPTISAAPGLAGDLAYRHAVGIDSYDMYCGHSSSLVAIHADKLTRAFIELFKSPELRKKMGEAGRLRATQNYDWRVIIPRYEQLWEEQSKIRDVASKAIHDKPKRSSQPPREWAARLDPTIGFANYPTQHLTRQTLLTLNEKSAKAALTRLAKFKELKMVNYANYMIPTELELESVFKVAEMNLPKGCSADTLIAAIAPKRQPYVLRALAWLCKLGLLRFS
jgi:glycosyltransferase involved in cell wall biosynthesis